MIKDVVIHNGLLNIATGTFVRMGRHSENPLAAEGLVLVSRLQVNEASCAPRTHANVCSLPDVQH
jgi:hypothetical protein